MAAPLIRGLCKDTATSESKYRVGRLSVQSRIISYAERIELALSDVS